MSEILHFVKFHNISRWFFKMILMHFFWFLLKSVSAFVPGLEKENIHTEVFAQFSLSLDRHLPLITL